MSTGELSILWSTGPAVHQDCPANTKPLKNLPLIDIAALQVGAGLPRLKAVSALGQALHTIGFVTIQGHGIPQATIARLREQVVALFDLPMDDKMALTVTPDNYRGYIPLGFFTPNADRNAADQYEGYKLHCEVDVTDPIRQRCDLYGPNKWPAQLPQLKLAVLDFWTECDRVTRLLLGALAEHMGLKPDYFSGAFETPLTNMTLLHYPPRETGTEENYGIHPHKDTDALTILAPDPVGGLYVREKESTDWIMADAPDDALVVNIGDMLEIWSGGYFVSTPHKVENNSGQERYSFPYFAVPRYDVQIKPVSSPDSAALDQRVMQVGEVSRQIWQSNWPDARPINTVNDPYSH